MPSLFQQLQQSTLEIQGIPATRKKLNELVDIMVNKEGIDHVYEVVGEMRELSPDTLRKLKGFHINHDESIFTIPEEYHTETYGFVRGGTWFVFEGRFVLPVYDVKRDVAGFVGWDKYADETGTKYLDAKFYGYQAKQGMFFGMEDMEYYYSDECDHVFIPEGPMCRAVLLENGFNALASLGSTYSPYMQVILKRLGPKAIVIHDRDAAGVVKLYPKLNKGIFGTRFYIPELAKDIDDERKENPNIFNELCERFNIKRNDRFKNRR